MRTPELLNKTVKQAFEKVQSLIPGFAVAISRCWSHRPVRYALIGGAVAVMIFAVALRYMQPPEEVIPEFGPLPDFAAISDVNEMKAAFFDYLAPMVAHHNQQILAKREVLDVLRLKMVQGEKLRNREIEQITELAREYRADWNPDEPMKSMRQLLMRVDVVPKELALVQAAKESGWGRSRFSVEANNLFGQWCFEPGCGVVPSRRNEGATHEVAKFPSVSDAVGSYIHNLNTNGSYETLRLIRAGMRSVDQQPTADRLVDGLLYYSERREAYVQEVKDMIRQYYSFQAKRHST